MEGPDRRSNGLRRQDVADHQEKQLCLLTGSAGTKAMTPSTQGLSFFAARFRQGRVLGVAKQEKKESKEREIVPQATRKRATQPVRRCRQKYSNRCLVVCLVSFFGPKLSFVPFLFLG